MLHAMHLANNDQSRNDTIGDVFRDTLSFLNWQNILAYMLLFSLFDGIYYLVMGRWPWQQDHGQVEESDKSDKGSVT